MEYQLFMEALEEFIMTDNIAVWETKVRPLLAKLVKSRIYATTRMAILRGTGLLLTDAAGRNVLVTAVELQALRAAKTMAARQAVWKGIQGAVGTVAPYICVAIFVFTTAKDGHALARVLSSDNQQSYSGYMNKYLEYIIKTAERGGNINYFPPPMNYERWLNKDQNLEWWQEK